LFLNNRHYDPSVGVFVSVDPLVTMTGQPYIYAGGNPVSYSDPSGLERCPTTGCNVDEHGRSGSRGGAVNPVGGTNGCGRCGEPIPATVRDSVVSNPSVLEKHLQDCWYFGSQCGSTLGGDGRYNADLLELSQSLLLQLTAMGAFVVGDGVLDSPHTGNPRGVKFRVIVGDGGVLHIVTIQGEPTSFSEMAAGAVAFVGDTASILELGGLAACP